MNPLRHPSRRSFLFSASAAAAALPILTESHFAWAAQQAPKEVLKSEPKPMSQQQMMKQAFMNMPKDACSHQCQREPPWPMRRRPLRHCLGSLQRRPL